MRIVLAGKHELSVKLFDYLRNLSEIDLHVITCQNEATDDSRVSLKNRLKECQFEPANQDFSHESLFEITSHLIPNLFISAGYDKIIKKEVIRSCKNCVNIHFGMLPKYRGSFSIPWAIINNENEIGITLHDIEDGIDDGPIINQVSIPNENSKSGYELYSQCVDKGMILLKNYYQDLHNGKQITKKAQDECKATYYPPQFPNDFKIAWRQTVAFVFNYIRACFFPPYDPAYCKIENKKIGMGFPLGYSIFRHNFPVGKIIEKDKKYYITVLNGAIEPYDIQIEDKWLHFAEYVRECSLLNNVILS